MCCDRAGSASQCFDPHFTFAECCGDGRGRALLAPPDLVQDEEVPRSSADVIAFAEVHFDKSPALDAATVNYTCNVELNGTRVPIVVAVFKYSEHEVDYVCQELQSDVYPLRARLAAEPELIIDVGANHGLFTMLLAHLYPEAEVIALEPNPLVVHMLRATVGARRAAARRSRVRVLHAALANASATPAYVHVCPAMAHFASAEAFAAELIAWHRAGGGGAGKERPNACHTTMTGVRRAASAAATRVWTLTLEDLVGYVGVRRDRTLVKLDCEGCELALLGDDAAGLAGFAALVGELHLPGEAETTFGSERELLRQLAASRLRSL